MDKDFLAAYALRRAERPIDARQDWTIGVLNRQVPFTPQTPNIWDPLMSSCISTCLLAGAGGYVVGLGFAFVFSAIEQREVDTKLGYRAQFAQAYKGTWRSMKTQARSFATFGSLYVAFECPIESFTGSRTPANSFVAGCLTGSTFALIGYSGIRGTLIGGVSCGVFCMLIELVMHR